MVPKPRWFGPENTSVVSNWNFLEFVNCVRIDRSRVVCCSLSTGRVLTKRAVVAW